MASLASSMAVHHLCNTWNDSKSKLLAHHLKHLCIDHCLQNINILVYLWDQSIDDTLQSFASAQGLC